MVTYTFYKSYSKLMIDQNIKYNTKNLQEENIEENLCDTRFGDEFLDTTPKA